MKAPDTISDARRQLLEKLRRGESHVFHRILPALSPRQPGSQTPLSPGQEQVWFHSQLSKNVPTYNESVTIHKRGPLDPLILERCFNEITRRHEIWRSAFSLIDGNVVQRIDPNVLISLPVTDLSHLPIEARESEALRIGSEDARRPFDLNVAPLFRVRLVRWARDHHRIYLTLHHLVFDGVSIYQVLVRELAALYTAYSAGEPSPLPELAFQYGDYSVWQREQLTTGSHAAQMKYWRETLSEDLSSLKLPSNRPHPAEPTWRGEMETFTVPVQVVEEVRKLGRSEETTPYMFLLAAFKVLLYRYSGQEEIIVGGAMNTRTRPEFEPLIGYFLNPVVFRSQVEANLSFREFLRCVKSTVLGALAHSDIPFNAVVRELASKRDFGRHPLFQVLFMLRPPFVDFPDDWSVADMEVHSGGSSFDLFVELSEHPDGLAGRIVYSTDLFDRATIQRLLGHFQTLLQELVADPDQAVSRANFLTERERHQLLLDWNATQTPYPQDLCIHQLFEQQAAQNPEAVAVVFGDHQLTYRELNRRSSQLASRLHSARVKPNDLVGICVERSLEMLVALLGILKAGGAYVPLDPAYPSDRLAFILEDCQPRILLTQRKLQKRLPSHRAQEICVDAVSVEDGSKENGPLRWDTCHPSDLAYVLYTSGSTGKPKGVQISHRAVVNFLSAMAREPGLGADDTLLAVTTLSFDIAGLELLLPLITGARVVIASREVAADGVRLSSLLKDCGATVMQATPATWRLLLAANWKGNPHLKILCGGEAWSSELAEELLPRCKSLWNMYGPTETTIWSSVARVETGQPIVIGSPIANTRFYILGASLDLVPVGVPGELYIGGEGLAQGYFNRPDLTKERFVNDPFRHRAGEKLYRTGDVVRRLSDGRIEFLHRIDQQVKIRGFRIELEEVESTLKQYPGVVQCVAVAREDTPGDKRLTAYTVSLNPHVAPSAAELRSFLKQKLPDYMVPSAFVTLEELPLTPNGKIDRKALSAQSLPVAECSPARQIVPPGTPLEHELVRIWEQILGVKITTVRQSFFDLGGHSLLAVQMFAEIEKVFGARLPLATLYTAPAIEDIAGILNREITSPGWSPLVPIQPSGSHTPFFCFHGAGGNVLIYRKLAQYLGPDQPFYGLQAQGLDGQSPPLKTIEEMAALYVKEIRGVQPRGPYLLGGYCLGGTIAYEAAQQLCAAGEEVALLALFDTTNWHLVRLTKWGKGFLHLQRLIFHTEAFLKTDSKNKHKFLKGKFHDLRHRIPVWWGMLATKLKGLSRGEAGNSQTLAEVWRANDWASSNYVPRPYPGIVTDFRPATQYKVLNQPHFKWDLLAEGGQRVVVVPGYPASMLLEPYVKFLASVLATCIEDASRNLEKRDTTGPDRLVAKASECMRFGITI